MRTPLRDTGALGAALLAPPAVAAVLVPFRTDLTNATMVLILVVVVVAVAAIGNRAAGAVAAVSSAAWFDFFLTLRTSGSPSTTPMTSRRRSCCWSWALSCRSSPPAPGGSRSSR